MEIITSWKRLFQLAHAEGQARLAHRDRPSEITKDRLDKAIAEHEGYRQAVLASDRTVGLENILADPYRNPEHHADQR
ncbi:hypothetical protein RPALISO_166 [Ruegeria phage RpAliso]|nr:hypothetical protein RPALISO_166 [Ruegeria phage RpAliso]